MNLAFNLSFSRNKLAAPANNSKTPKRILPHTLKAVSRMRADIKIWNEARQTAESETPKNYALQLLLSDAMHDALLTSQIENRKNQVYSVPLQLANATGQIDQEQTDLLAAMPAYRQITNAVLDAIYYGYTLVELSLTPGVPGATLPSLKAIILPRTNVVPATGLYYPDYAEDKTIPYRQLKEYGTWILEFDTETHGLINKAVPHVLFKRFAQSCWSELCEIYGIPPRVMKTNTQDPAMMKRAETMMSDMGAAAWFIIDDTENFEWAQTADTNGDVYRNLIALCNNEMSMLVSGAVIGQDTVNGNRSKEESSQNMLWELVKADMNMLETYWNHSILPAFVKMGLVKPGLVAAFAPSQDLDQLWKFAAGALPYYNIDPEWMKKTFGLEITTERTTTATNNLSTEAASFFD